MNPAAAELPPLREELELLPGPTLADGQPSWTLHDPVRHQFFRLDWTTFEILTRWSMRRAAHIVENLRTATTLQVDATEVDRVARFLSENQLLRPTGPDAARRLAERWQATRQSPLLWLLHHYLFFRVRLVKPDAWLDRLAPLAALFFTRGFMLATGVALLAGLFLISRQADVFITSLVDTFSLEGLVAYGVALIGVKTLHELGHAFTAKRNGCKVPAMGVAFIVLWPMAYTDTNEVWRLTDRYKRLHVSSAGILTELVVAIWASLAWALMPDGGLRGALFVLATTSWVATLAINASPFMRFDGYFILSDWIDMPNLHGRAFAMARWRLREWLFALGDEPPEHFSRATSRRLIAFAWATWIYRFVVFLGIAVLVYHFFFKLLGIALFAVEIAWFIVMPVARELKVWRTRLGDVSRRPASRRRLVRVSVVLAVLLAVLFVPWSSRVVTTGLLRPAEIWTAFAPGGALLLRTELAEGRTVPEGATLATFAANDARTREAVLVARVQRLRSELAAAGFSEEARAELGSLREALRTAEAELRSVQSDLARYSLEAPFAGRLRDIDPDLRPGQWVAPRERLAVLVGDGRIVVETYLDEEVVRRVEAGAPGIFFSESLAGPVLSVRVVQIDADATRVLPSGVLSAQAGGHVLTRQNKDKGELVPELGVYRVLLEVETPIGELAGQTWRGRLSIRGAPESLAGRYARQAWAILTRESGF